MLVKLLTALVILVALVWMLVPRPQAGRRGVGSGQAGDRLERGAQPPTRAPHAHDLVRCAECGVWLPSGQPCDCGERV